MEHSVTIKYNKIFFLGKRKRKSSITPARISIRHGTDERIRERQTINCRDQYTKLYFTDYYFPHSHHIPSSNNNLKRNVNKRQGWRDRFRTRGSNFTTSSRVLLSLREDKGIRFFDNQDPSVLASPKVSLRFVPPMADRSIVPRDELLGSMCAHNHERTCVRARYQTMAIPTREPNPPQPSTDILCPWRWGGFWSRFDGGGWIGRRKWNRK